MDPALTPSRRAELRAAAHKLKPVVIIGDKGLTDTVVAEIDRALAAHELIKVRAGSDDRAARSAWMDEICGRLAAHPVQEIGKVLVIYRLNPEKQKAVEPPPAPRKRPARKASARKQPPKLKVEATGSERRRSRTPLRPPESGPRRRRPNTSR